MTDKQTAKLHEAIREVTLKIQRFQGRDLGEQNTKASLIEPITACFRSYSSPAHHAESPCRLIRAGQPLFRKR
jgi:hypothetical protein